MGKSSMLVKQPSRYLTVAQCEQEYPYAADKFRNWAARGLIGSVKIGGKKSRLLLVRKDIDDLFARNLRPRRQVGSRQENANV